jgi:hypothetical protein
MGADGGRSFEILEENAHSASRGWGSGVQNL